MIDHVASVAVPVLASFIMYRQKHALLFVPVPKDPKPQWRRVAWSYDCTLLAYAESTGTVRVFDLVGSELFVIAPVRALQPVTGPSLSPRVSSRVHAGEESGSGARNLKSRR